MKEEFRSRVYTNRPRNGNSERRQEKTIYLNSNTERIKNQ